MIANLLCEEERKNKVFNTNVIKRDYTSFDYKYVEIRTVMFNIK